MRFRILNVDMINIDTTLIRSEYMEHINACPESRENIVSSYMNNHVDKNHQFNSFILIYTYTKLLTTLTTGL